MADFVRPEPAPAAELLSRLLYAVSHDLRSPALTLSLSGELIEDAARPPTAATPDSSPRGERLDVGLHGLREGGRDLERMLGAVTVLSRAWHRELAPRTLPLAELLEGRPLAAADPTLPTLAVHLDPAPAVELLTLLAGAAPPPRVELERDGADAVLCLVHALELPPLEESPLAALCGSLTAYAGTVLERAAALQLLLERQGAALELGAAEARLWLPLASSAQVAASPGAHALAAERTA